VTITDRFRAAWSAFKQNTKPDPDAYKKYLAKREEERASALNKLEPYDKALVTSIAGGTANWERLLDQVTPAVQRLDPDDQYQIMMHICGRNPQAVLNANVRSWCQKRENIQTMIRRTTQQENTVIVVRE
jgi:hypothetical protein